MATLKIQYQCGCKYVTDKVEEAIKHCDKKGHTLTVSGLVKKNEKA